MPPRSSTVLVPGIPVGQLDEYRRNYSLVDAATVLYVFLGSPTATRSLAVPWSHRLERDHVYLRTRGDLYWTPFRTIRRLARVLADPGFQPVARGVYVRLGQFAEVNVAARQIGAVIRTGERPSEWIRCSKRGWRNVSRHLALPRVPGRPMPRVTPGDAQRPLVAPTVPRERRARLRTRSR